MEKENNFIFIVENIALVVVVTGGEHSMSLVIVIKLMEVGGSLRVSVPTDWTDLGG